jgi:lysozyme
MRLCLGLCSIALLLTACGEEAPHPYVGGAESVGNALSICPAGSTIQGADVSSYQATIDWANIAADGGLSFAIAKATEGLTVHDSEFAANWSGMKSNHIIRGAYHFFHSQDDGAAQADVFLAQVGTLEADDLPPFLDWEATDTGTTSAQAIQRAQAFIDEIYVKTGRTTVIYTYPSFWAGLGNTSQFASYPVWFANYGVTCPNIPSPWTGWVFWQYSSSGTVPGMNCTGACDVDEFNGTLADLQTFVQETQNQCHVEQASCSVDTDCCSPLTCQNGSCEAPVCAVKWGACTSSSGCCSGLSCLTWTPSGQSAGTYCCEAVGASCTSGRDCCGGSLCSANGVCLCVPQGTYCQNDVDCCNAMTCQSGKCEPPTSTSTATTGTNSSGTSGHNSATSSTGTTSTSANTTATSTTSTTSGSGGTSASSGTFGAVGTSGTATTSSTGNSTGSTGTSHGCGCTTGGELGSLFVPLMLMRRRRVRHG